MHFVIIRFSSLGDVILQSSFCAWMKLHFKDCKITFITSQEFSSLITNHPYIDNVLTINRLKGIDDIKQLMSLSVKIQDELEADLIIDLHNTLRAKLLRLFCYKVPHIIVNKRSFLRFILIRLKMNFLNKLESHHLRVINDLKFYFNREFETEQLVEFNTTNTLTERIGLTTVPYSFTKVNKKFSKKYIVVSPIASFAPKRWPMSYFKDLVEMMLDDKSFDEYHFVLVAGPNDTYCDEMISDKIKTSNRFDNLQGKTTIAETTEVIAHAELCISNDTGTTHIAESFGKPVITIFGPTSESFGFKPHLTESRAVSLDIWCRPCSGTGKKKCFRKEQYCMVNLKPEIVYNQVRQSLHL